MLKNPRNLKTYNGHNNGCSCCNTKNERRKGKKSAKYNESKMWKNAEHEN